MFEAYQRHVTTVIGNVKQYTIEKIKFNQYVKDIDNKTELIYPPQAKDLFNKDYKVVVPILLENSEEQLKGLRETPDFAQKFEECSKEAAKDDKVKAYTGQLEELLENKDKK